MMVMQAFKWISIDFLLINDYCAKANSKNHSLMDFELKFLSPFSCCAMMTCANGEAFSYRLISQR